MPDSQWRKQTREVYKRGNAISISVLPYNKDRQIVLLVRQLRIPAYLAQSKGTILEICAGIIDEGEMSHQAMQREAEEE